MTVVRCCEIEYKASKSLLKPYVVLLPDLNDRVVGTREAGRSVTPTVVTPTSVRIWRVVPGQCTFNSSNQYVSRGSLVCSYHEPSPWIWWRVGAIRSAPKVVSRSAAAHSMLVTPRPYRRTREREEGGFAAAGSRSRATRSARGPPTDRYGSRSRVVLIR